MKDIKAKLPKNNPGLIQSFPFMDNLIGSVVIKFLTNKQSLILQDIHSKVFRWIVKIKIFKYIDIWKALHWYCQGFRLLGRIQI